MYQAPLHRRHPIVSAHLTTELRKRYSTRSVPVRKGDQVKIMRGAFKGKSGKVMRVSLKRYSVYIDGIIRSKTDGTKVFVPMDSSKLLITDLDVSDKKRMEALKRCIPKG